MFKIVQIIQRGLKQLRIVPSAWENNNQLSWPKMGSDKLIRKANSVPEANWFTMVCKLKRNHLISYEIAHEELQRMLENHDTEQEEIRELFQRKKRPRVMLPKTTPSQRDFNSLANECMLPLLEKSGVESSADLQVTDVIVPQSMLETGNISSQLLPNDETFSSVFGTAVTSSLDPHLNEKFEKILTNQKIIIKNQQEFLNNFKHSTCQENQQKILQHFAILQTTLDIMTSHSFNTCTCKTANQTTLLAPNEDIFFDPISTLAELERVEAKLANKTDMEDYVQKFSYVCGRKGSGNGISNCYILVDKIFTRKFMTLCSWAGGARNGQEKIPFKIFKNVIGLFFRVVRLSDEDFTLKNCEEFFKAVIRNSAKRNESSLVRSSRSKNRPSSLSYKTRKEKQGIKENNINDVDGTKDIREIIEEGNLSYNYNIAEIDVAKEIKLEAAERIVDEETGINNDFEFKKCFY